MNAAERRAALEALEARTGAAFAVWYGRAVRATELAPESLPPQLADGPRPPWLFLPAMYLSLDNADALARQLAAQVLDWRRHRLSLRLERALPARLAMWIARRLPGWAVRRWGR